MVGTQKILDPWCLVPLFSFLFCLLRSWSEKGKWVKVQGWEGPEAAKKEITDGIRNYTAANKA